MFYQIIMHVSMWILHPTPDWPNEFWWRKKFLLETPTLPFTFNSYHCQNPLPRSIYLPFVMSECQKELSLSEYPVWSDGPLSYVGEGRGGQDSLWNVHYSGSLANKFRSEQIATGSEQIAIGSEQFATGTIFFNIVFF